MAKLNKSLRVGIGLLITVVVLSIILGIILWLKTPKIGNVNNMDPTFIAATQMNTTATANSNMWSSLGTMGQNLGEPFGQWFVFVIFFIILIMFILGGVGIYSIVKGTRRSAAYKGTNSSRGGFLKRVTDSLSNVSNPIGKKAYNATSRLVEKNGRCDNINWVSIEDKQKQISLCFDMNFKPPEPVRFIIDPTNLFEYDKLPNALKQKLRTDSNKLSITVPYMYNEKPSAYVLNFKNAVFEDGTSASYLFDQRFNYDYWMFQTQNLTNVGKNKQNYMYTNKYRPTKTSSDYDGIDVFK